MPGLRLSFLLAIPTIIVGLLLTRSPFMMTSTAPSEGKPWADGPMKLIPTPQFQTKKVLYLPGNYPSLTHLFLDPYG